MAVELTDKFLAAIAGWEAVKLARIYLAGGKVLSSNWTPPVLRGVVQDGSIAYRAGLVIKSESDIENLCTCRPSREWGTICAHSVAVGLRHLKPASVTPPPPPSSPGRPTPPREVPQRQSAGRRLHRVAEPAGAEAAELHVILPPNCAQAIERGKIMLCLEGSWRGGRTPLNALPNSKQFSFSPQDQALLDQLEMLAGGDTPAVLMVGTADFADLLRLLKGHPRMTLGKSNPVTVTAEIWVPAIKATLEQNGEITLTWKSQASAPVLIEAKWVFHQGSFRPLALPDCCRSLLAGPVRLARTAVPQFLSQDWPRLQAAPQVEANFRLENFTVEPQVPKFLLHLAGGLAQLDATLQCAYGRRIMAAGASAAQESPWLPDPASPVRYSTRDTQAEQAALARLLRSGFSSPDDRGCCRMRGQDRVLNFLAREFPRLQKVWEVTLEEKFERSTRQNIERIQPKLEVLSSGVQWFDLSVSYEAAGGERLTPAEVQRLLLSGQSYTRLRNGRLAILDTGAVEELQESLLDCAPVQQDGRYRIAGAQAGFIDATVREQGWTMKAPSGWEQRARQQGADASLSCPALGHLEGVLRPYQKQGVAWMCFLRAHGFGGILADEMGLGKTLQMLALLHGLKARKSAAGTSSDLKTTLVICPTSLVFNWMAEVRKFVPELRALALHGPDRHQLFQGIPETDLVVTSYALIRRDLERYQPFEFDTVVLDEAQHIKNRQTQNAQAVKAVRSAHRLVLTGTPLENSVLDLWSIFDFLMPGYLGSAKDFRERYELPIARDRQPAAQARLARRLRPFILRRLKRDVAVELPPKIEQVAFCELNDDQRAVYQQIMQAGRKEMTEASGQGTGRARLAALNALLRLRQVCCDVRLLKIEPPSPPSPSGKIELFGELIEEALDGGHRVLVFSQFVSMLTLLRQTLAEQDIEYCYLDGSTVNREQEVTRFRQSQTPVFLISLKAGGVGLNLSEADTVIHFDPWWNPAVEAQATDRAHRIGQTRVVTSYKLIARGTVEEKILQLQERKREITRAMLGGEESFVEALSWEEIQELLLP